MKLSKTFELVDVLRLINKRLEKVLMNQAELAAQLTEIGAQIAKIGEESAATLLKVTELEEALENAGDVTPEVQAAFDALKAQVQVVDDLVPDAPTP
jgi:predicted transcriptional regulator